jgi:hypothetical protein
MVIQVAHPSTTKNPSQDQIRTAMSRKLVAVGYRGF